MLWLKVAIPALMVLVGGGAVAVAASGDDAPPTGPAQVWIDAPTGIAPFAPGAVTVVAHATADDAIAGLDLFVDDAKVATDSSLVRNDLLVFGEFSWDAKVGVHELVVKQAGGGKASDVLVVQVVEGAPEAPAPTTTTTTRPGDTTTSSTSTTSSTTSTTEPGETTTTRPGEAPTTTRPSGTVTIPPTTAVPTTRPPATTIPPTPKPVIDAANFVGTPTVYAAQCVYSVQVSARLRDASSATVVVSGTHVAISMSRSSSTWSATINSGFYPNEVGARTVYVTATNAAGQVQRTVGTLTIKPGCPKD